MDESCNLDDRENDGFMHRAEPDEIALSLS